MELSQVKAFLTLAEELHFGRTAQRLYLSQSRVSRLVSSLEQEVGGKLFDRSSRAVSLTPLGQFLCSGLRTRATHSASEAIDLIARREIVHVTVESVGLVERADIRLIPVSDLPPCRSGSSGCGPPSTNGFWPWPSSSGTKTPTYSCRVRPHGRQAVIQVGAGHFCTRVSVREARDPSDGGCLV